MKEIDFIPQWHKAGRERKRRYIRQYALMAFLFAMMATWGFVVNGHVARVSAEVEGIQTSLERERLRGEQAILLESRIAEMRQKTVLLDKVTPRTKMTAILGELSYLIGENVILSKLALRNKLIENPGKKNVSATSAVVYAGGSQKNDRNEVISALPSHCVVVLTGIAARPADAALLIVRLEKTDYFNQVSLVYSKPKKVRDKDVTEFEIRCFVADYQYLK